MSDLTPDELARLRLKAKHGMLTAEERAALEAYEAAAQPAPQTPVPADTETLLCCPYCGHATITTQIVSDVTYRKPATVIAMMFAPLIAVVLAFLLRNMFVTVLALIVVIVSALVPMWAFYRGNYSVTHKYYVCKRCGYAERDTKWKIVNDGGKAIEEMQQRRDECFKHIGKAMYESCPELGDMSVADMRKAGRYLHKMLTKKAPSQGAAPARNGAPVASDSGSTSAPDGREPMPVSGYGEGM